MRLPRPVLAVTLLLPTAGALVYFVAADPNDPLFRVTYAASKVIQFALPIAARMILDRSRLRAVRPSARGLQAGAAVGLLTLVVLLAAYLGVFREAPLLAGLAESVRAKATGFGLDAPAGFVALAVVLSVAHSFLEEYYWRWFVHAGLREYLSRVPATIVSSLAFAAHHVVVLAVYFPDRFWTATVPFSMGVAVGGAVWAWLYDRYGSLAGPWAAHLLADAALMAVGFDLLYR